MSEATSATLVPDDEIREWARATGRKVGERGRVSPALREEYEQQLAGLHAGPGAPPDGPAPGGPQPAAERPRAAAQETIPRRVPQARKSGLGRLRIWFNGATTDAKGKTTPKAKPDRPRTPVTRLVERGWSRLASVAEHVNVPVARTMAWQAPYVGVVAEDIIAHTPVDKLLQPIAKAETALSGAGAMIAMPIVVGLITAERNDPQRHGVAAAARQQALHAVLEECIDAQLEMFGSRDLAAKILKSAADQQKRGTEIGAIMGMIFAPLPPEVIVPDNPTEAQVKAAQAEQARHAEEELALREAAAAIRYMPPPGQPDERGQAAEHAAASMAASAAAAAAAQDAAIAAATGS